MQKSRYERVMDRITARIDRVSGNVSQQLQDSKPFDKPVPDMKEEYYKYAMMTPEDKAFAAQNFGFQWIAYEQKMQQIGRRYSND